MSSSNTDAINHCWEAFVEKGINPGNTIRPVIAKSWLRSQKIIDSSSFNRQLLPRDILDNLRNNCAELLSVVELVMNDISAISGRNFVAFCDSNGYVLKTIVNADFADPLGSRCSEGDMGTNAIGLALIEGTPIEIKGHEHYLTNYHSYSCVAVPIHDPLGRIIGVIDVTNPLGNLPDGVKQVVELGVKVIENYLRWSYERSRFQETDRTVNLILNLVENFCLVLDKHGKIVNANDKVLKLLMIEDKSQLIGTSAQDLISSSQKFADTLMDNNKHYSGQRFKLKLQGQTIPCSLLDRKTIQGEHEKTILTFSVEQSAIITRATVPKLNRLNPVETIVGQSQLWRNVEHLARRAAKVNSNVLLEGESGTGKEVIAKLIHRESCRDGAFVAINCGAIPKELLQSELFGYEEGSFTGACKGGMAGKIELANHGTLLLDEIGEMPLHMQVSLLRFLQDRTITRVGGSIDKRIDVQIIAATNRDIAAEVARGNFREDLYYRLNVINLKLPALRDRKEDIPLYASWFLVRYCEKLNTGIVDIDEGAMLLLCRYDWPGNVRELTNVIESAVVFAAGGSITPECLPARIRDCTPNAGYTPKNLKNYEEKIIEKTLNSCEGNISKAAKSLGMARNTLYRKMARMSLYN